MAAPPCHCSSKGSLDIQIIIARASITDTITRFLRSLDDGNPELLSQCLTDDMVMDLTPLNTTGTSYPKIEGRDVVIPKLMHAVGKTMDSAHHVSNFLFDFNESKDEALVSCYALAQHFRLGEGPSLDFNEYCVMGNRYQVTMVCDQAKDKWDIKRFVVSSMWAQGKVEVMSV
jgi:hypothetical protein